MVRSLTKRGWRDHIASLKRQADAGEVSAMTDLGLNLLEGIQDREGRSMVRRNPRLAITWFRRAANRGDSTAASSLGYAYDVGPGTKRNVAQAIRWYRRAARLGNSTAMSNLATVYRDAGKARLAFQWWKRASDMRDGDAAVDVGYCYQYGREEAMYHLAVQFIDKGNRRLAFPLLKGAIADDDFPEAASVLNQLKSESACVPCRCKRFINKRLRGHTKCSLHAG
jgi:TPR repeat protein